METLFFESPAVFRKWLEKNHDKKTELWVGFYKRATGRPSITWPESVDEALCFGWIDGVRKAVDEHSYKIRFSPRRSRSTWSAVNTRRATELLKIGRMHPAGVKAFEARLENKTGIYSYEKRPSKLDEIYEQKFRKNKKAWQYFQSKPAWYQRAAIWWIISARREETRCKRLDILIEDSANGRSIGPLNRPPKTKE